LSTLTKTFVLLVSILSIFLCGVVVIFVVNTNDYRTAYDSQVTAARAAQTQAKLAEDALARGLLSHQVLTQLQNRTNQELQRQYAVLLRQVQVESEKRATAEGAEVTAINTVASLQETITNMYEVQKAIQTALQEAHSQMNDAQVQVVGLTRQLNETRVRELDLESLSRVRLAKNMELEEIISQLWAQVADVKVTDQDWVARDDKVSQSPIQAGGVPIRGTVTEVADDRASISVGTADGVHRNMTFKIYRNENYLGDLLVTYVLPNEAAGTLVLQVGSVVTGDTVTTAFN